MEFIQFPYHDELVTIPVKDIYFSNKLENGLNEEDRRMMVDVMNDWGTDYDLDDYIYLEERYTYYSGGKALTPAAQSTLRLMCLSELEIRKAKAIGEETVKLEKQYTDYLKMLGLSNFTLGDTKKPYEKTLEKWIEIEEQTDPIDWVNAHYDDICGFRVDNDDIMRAIANKALGTRNYPELTEDMVVSKKIPERNDLKKKRGRPRKSDY